MSYPPAPPHEVLSPARTESSRKRDLSRQPSEDRHRDNDRRRHQGRNRERDFSEVDDHNGRHGRTRHSQRTSRSPDRHRRRHRRSVSPLDRWRRPVNLWDKAPEGFEGVSAAEAKASGKFLLPIHTMATRPDTDRRDGRDSRHRDRRMDDRSRRPTGSSANTIPLGGGRSVANDVDPITRVKLRLYVGNLGQDADHAALSDFFVALLVQAEAIRPYDRAINRCHVNAEKGFAFVEFQTPELAEIALAMDGVVFNQNELRLRRPKDYYSTLGIPDPATTAGGLTAGRSHSNQSELGSAAPLGSGGISSHIPNSPHKIYIGSIPRHITETQLIELLQSFGPLKGFHLVKDSDTNESRGFAFCEFMQPEVIESVCQGLNGMELGDRRLVVQPASSSGGGAGGQSGMHGSGGGRPGGYGQAAMPYGGTGANAYPPTAPTTSGGSTHLPPSLAAAFQSASQATEHGQPPLIQPTCIVQLLNMVTPDELGDDEEFSDILEDVKEECGRFGTVVNVRIPRPEPGRQVPGIGKIFVEFASLSQATDALRALAGRKFAQRTVLTSYITPADFEAENY
ncbi:hypothetical protein IWQ60_004347 [Tieghemiomyces parasiticus]|uniref:RRM domain-containing protein n=1 Tax=Tieghemiomyces parasiticus TaxID=78921 RepID=A0A9W8A7Z8_9FUNG|nr:hypothetical protein IWQ60_004347 [Tieghemiomyces parasiticus]